MVLSCWRVLSPVDVVIMRHAALLLFACALLTGCPQSEDRGAAPASELDRLGLSATPLRLAHGRIVGSISSTRYYREVVLLVHIYDGEGARISETYITLENLLPNEPVRIDAEPKASVPLPPRSRAELKYAVAKE